MRKESGLNRRRHYASYFFLVYFLYYAGYCVFSSYIVLYLTERSYSATVCGIITSLTLLANLVMESIGGYITDTFLSTRRYLTVCIGIVSLVCIFCTAFSGQPFFLLPAMVLVAGIMYPFSQLMDAWVSMSQEVYPGLVYSRIRAGGSIGFAAMSIAGGYYFKYNGWNHYFLLQMALFLAMAPFFIRLPDISLGNQKKGTEKKRLSPAEVLRVMAENKKFCFCLLICTLYWFSHRPIGSYLSLLVTGRGGDASTYGRICGVGASVESLSLLVLPWILWRWQVRSLRCLTAALAADLLRPLCFLLLPGLWSFYLGQMMQSVSFALFYSASLECFAETADRRIRSLCISFGLTASSVAGTVLANLLGGILCDALGVGFLTLLSLSASAANLAVCQIGQRRFSNN